jgi:polyhydroxybutyrate depolymerase
MKNKKWLFTVGIVVVLVVAGLTIIWNSGATSGQPATAQAPIVKAVLAKAVTPIKAPGTTTTTYAVQAGGRERDYEVIAPDKALPKTAPIIVMLAGLSPPTASGAAVVASEASRDDLLPYATSDQAEVVYPEPLYGSWNAIGCCAKAAATNVNDLAFLKAVVANVDPGHARQIDVVGYSNGARLAYRAACDLPGLFDEYAMVKGEPTAGCTISKPTTIIQLASTNDPEVPYQPGDHGSIESLPTTTLVASLRATDKCPQASTSSHDGNMTQTTWSACADGARLALAAWSAGVHSFPKPPVSVPAAASVIWSFFTESPLAPLPEG